MREWRSKSTAPKDGSLILACHSDPARQIPMVIYWDDGSAAFHISGRWRSSTHDVVDEIRFTHWMPLPEPPEANT